jgi:hypothetical protein
MGQLTIFRYYQVLFALFLFLCVYSLVFADSFSDDKCYKTADASPTTSLVVMPSVMGYFYLVLVCVVFIESMIIWYFSSLEIAKFASLNMCQRAFGRTYKCLPYLVIILHWIVLVFILTQIFLVFVVRDCTDAIHKDKQDGTTTKGLMQAQAEFQVLVTLVLWTFIHCVGGPIRRSSYYDAFFYQPEESGASKLYNWLCIKCGP